MEDYSLFKHKIACKKQNLPLILCSLVPIKHGFSYTYGLITIFYSGTYLLQGKKLITVETSHYIIPLLKDSETQIHKLINAFTHIKKVKS